MAELLDWQTVADPRAAVRRAASVLRGGGVVLFPTESEYTLAASALRPEAIGRLGTAAPAVAVRGAGEARDWVPDMGTMARRLARRCWPGPVTLSFAAGADVGVARRLPEAARAVVCPGPLRLRSPAHEAILEVIRRLNVPLAVTGVATDPDANLDSLVRSLEGRADLILLDGPCPYPEGTTEVAVEGESWRLLRPGALTEEALRRQSACVVVFVCTGNTCRSPLAEALFKKRLADRLGCAAAELPGRGYHVVSAGLAAVSGGPAAEEARDVAATYGGDLGAHHSRPLTAELAAQADYLIAMTRGHARALAELPRLGCRPRLLRADGHDVADPIGQPRPVYEECGRQVWAELEALAAEVAPATSSAG
jgi:protein-tyrosine phosphatase